MDSTAISYGTTSAICGDALASEASGHEQPSKVRSNTSLNEETNMTEPQYPNESTEYRDARESLADNTPSASTR